MTVVPNWRKAMLGMMGAMAVGAVPAQAMDGVVASIKPVHAIVAAVMGDTGTPGLVVAGAGSPHTYSLKPSQARLLQDARLVFWVGPRLESFLEGPLETLTGNASTVSLMEADGLTLIDLREGGAFETHSHAGEHHDEHGEGHDDHDHDHDGVEHGDHAAHADHAGHEDGGREDDGDEHAHGGVDPHIWLDPRNAAAMAHAAAEALAEADPDNAETYQANADAFEVQMARLEDELKAALAPVRDAGFIVFHDAYHMFESRFGLEASGSVTISPDARPGAERIAELREKIARTGVACVFAEPQFEPKIIETIAEGTDARVGVLDPLGAKLEAGASLYPALLRNMAAEFRRCLAG
ncbi:zinc ABC transporter substrate-binding protein [Tepidamorphus sp. 3E244]|uniref:zinc ABC transporter substrate-binding protein n=1 Tax=Tepidamorphus sp. 3E244 TaxID=3385498 RepID=UPI0038FCC2DD